MKFCKFAAIFLILSLLLATMPSYSAHAATLTVTNNLNSGAGSLRQAIADSTPGDTINFFDDYTITLLSELEVNKDLTIDGAGHTITISGDDTTRVMSIINGATVSLNSLTITNGLHGYGGGINNNGSLTITDSTFANNSGSEGAGINNTGSLTISNCTFSQNVGSYGGGIRNSASMTITNSTFSNNDTYYTGGGIYNTGLLTITNSTFSNNSAVIYGGGIFTYGGSITLINTIVAESPGGDCAINNGGTITADSYNLDTDGSCDSATTSTAVEIRLGALTDNGGPTHTMALGSGSSAINTGTNTGCPATDQRGVTRPIGTTCDIGAYEGATRTVTNNNDSGSGSLRQAIADSTASDTINFNDDYTITLDSALFVDKYLTIDGRGHTIIISGGGTTNVMLIYSDATVSLNALTITNGIGYGGGIFNEGTLTITNSTFSENIGDTYGGGIYNQGSLNIVNSTFSNNEAVSTGGGIYTLGSLTITNSTFSHNAASVGGGVYNQAPMTITNSTFFNNAADTWGGGVYNQAPMTITNSTFSGNEATWGAGIVNRDMLTITNSTFSDNAADNKGGGIYYIEGTLTITNSTFSGNSAGSEGGGIFSNYTAATLKNTIIANSPSGGDCAAGSGSAITANAYNLDTDGSCGDATTSTAAGIRLGALADNGGPTYTMALGSGSSAIEAGTNIDCPDTDQRGVTRPIGFSCDIGAYEAEVALLFTPLFLH